MEVDLECNSPLDFDDDAEQVNNVDEHNESEGLNGTELLCLSKAGSQGVLTEELQLFVERESRFRCPYSCYLHGQVGPRKLRTRVKGVQWILKTQKTHDLSVITASLAVNYLDRVLNLLSAKDLDTFQLEVLPIACLSIACKMDERFEYSPEELQLFSPPFAVVPSQLVSKMEETVLLSLDWRVSSLVPVSFVNHMLCLLAPFSNTQDPTTESSLTLETDTLDKWLDMIKSACERSCRYLLLGLADVELLTFRPSELALTAVLAALDPELVSTNALQTALDSVGSSANRIESCNEELQRVLSDQKPDGSTQTDTLPVPSTPEQKISLPRRAILSPSFKENSAKRSAGKSLKLEAYVLRDLNAEVARGGKRESSGVGSVQTGDQCAQKGDQISARAVDGVAYRQVEVDGHVAKAARR